MLAPSPSSRFDSLACSDNLPLSLQLEHDHLEIVLQCHVGDPNQWLGYKYCTRSSEDAVRQIKTFVKQGSLLIWVQIYTDNKVSDSYQSMTLSQYIYYRKDNGKYGLAYWVKSGSEDINYDHPIMHLLHDYKPRQENINYWLKTQFNQRKWYAKEIEPLTYP